MLTFVRFVLLPFFLSPFRHAQLRNTRFCEPAGLQGCPFDVHAVRAEHGYADAGGVLEEVFVELYRRARAIWMDSFENQTDASDSVWSEGS